MQAEMPREPLTYVAPYTAMHCPAVQQDKIRARSLRFNVKTHRYSLFKSLPSNSRNTAPSRATSSISCAEESEIRRRDAPCGYRRRANSRDQNPSLAQRFAELQGFIVIPHDQWLDRGIGGQ